MKKEHETEKLHFHFCRPTISTLMDPGGDHNPPHSFLWSPKPKIKGEITSAEKSNKPEAEISTYIVIVEISQRSLKQGITKLVHEPPIYRNNWRGDHEEEMQHRDQSMHLAPSLRNEYLLDVYGPGTNENIG